MIQRNASEFDPTARQAELLAEQHEGICRATDQLFVWLMCLQWAGGIMVAHFITPNTWIGETSSPHVHFWAAWLLGGVISALPIYLGLRYPGRPITRHVITVAQAIWSALLIHLTGGRIETHFHVFGSLALLAFYRDYSVIISATVIIAADHFVRGMWWPQSVFGVFVESPYRWIEHAMWVLFEDVFLFASLSHARKDMRELCLRQAELEMTNRNIENTVRERTDELRQARNFFRAVMDSIQASICIVDEKGTIIDTNAYWSDFAAGNGGSLPALGVGSNYVETCLRTEGDCRPGALAVVSAIQSIFRGDIQHYVKEYPCHSDVEQRWFQVRISALSTGESVSVVIAHLDVTERVLANEQLAAAKIEAEQLAHVAKYTDNAVVITDAAGNVEWVNEGFQRVTGYSLDEVRGHKPGSFLQGPDTDPSTIEHMRASLEKEEGFDVELINYHKNGEKYWVAIEVRPIRDEIGRVIKFIAVESDITERKDAAAERQKLSQELIAASRQAGMAEVATGVLHNIGNVLNSVNVSLELVDDCLRKSTIPNICRAGELVRANLDSFADYVGNDERGKHLPGFLGLATEKLGNDYDAVEQEIKGMRSNVEHIKEVVAMQQAYAKQEPLRERVSVSRLIDDSINAVGLSVNKHGIDMQVEYNFVGDIVTDKHAVIQILVNLLMNAKQAVLESGHSEPRIRIVTDGAERDAVCISVYDNGVGIEPDQFSRIFEHGFTTKNSGHGFGLHSSANTAKSLSGTLRGHSLGLGHGATFTLELPISSPEADQCQQTPKPAMAGS